MINIDGVDYITLAEYAAKAGLLDSSVRQKCARGGLPCIKLGRNWFIKADTPIKVDARVKTGEYKNWRKKAD